MTSMQINSIFYTVDANKDGVVTDQMWGDFYTTFVEPFYKCDTNGDNLID